MKKFGHDIPETRLETGLLEPNKEHEALHPILVKEYREGGHYAGLMELFVDIDEGLQEWRYRRKDGRENDRYKSGHGRLEWR